MKVVLNQWRLALLCLYFFAMAVLIAVVPWNYRYPRFPNTPSNHQTVPAPVGYAPIWSPPPPPPDLEKDAVGEREVDTGRLLLEILATTAASGFAFLLGLLVERSNTRS